MGRHGLPRHGRILLPARGDAGADRTHRRFGRVGADLNAPDERQRLRFLLLLGALPFFGQLFHYLVELVPLYYLSKASPVLVLPLTLYGLIWLKLPYKRLYVVMLAYMLGVTPALSMIHLGNSLFDALATTVKALPFTYYFAFSALLFLISPSLKYLKFSFLVLGFATFGLMILLWVLVPHDYYATSQKDAKLFIYEPERGYRIYMPMFFGVLVLFYLIRRFAQRREVWTLLLLAVGFASMVLIYKQRTAIGAAVVVVGYGFVMSLPMRARIATLLSSLVLVLGLAAIVLAPSLGKMLGSFGGSLSTRQNTMELALNYLSVDASRWIFGVGAITRFSDVTFADVFGSQLFFLADIGWVGVVFEYGVVGALLIAAAYLAALRTALRIDGKDPFVRALGDYVIYLFLSSTVYSVVYTPGEVATVMAVAVYYLKAQSIQARG